MRNQEQEQAPGSLDLRALAPLALVAFAIAAISAMVVSSGGTPVYAASASVGEANTLRANVIEVQAAVRRLEFYANVAESIPILDRAVARLELEETGQALRRRVEATVSGDGGAVEITVEGRDAALAAALANVIAEEVVATTSGEGSSTLATTIDEELQALIDRLGKLERRIGRLAGLEELNARQQARKDRLQRGLSAAPSSYARLVPYSSAGSIGGLNILDLAVRPTTPIRPTPLIDGLLAGVLGIVTVLPLAYVPNFLRGRLSDADDVRAETGLPIIAEVPRVNGDTWRPPLGRRPVLEAPTSEAAEAYRRLALAAIMSGPADTPRVILVAAPRRSDAKSATAANLALALAEASRSVVLVDADLDAPRIHRMLGVENGRGLAEWLDATETDHRTLLVQAGLPGLSVLTAGDVGAHHGEHVGRGAMRHVLARLRADHDVIIDGPPLRESAAAQVLGSSVDSLVLALAAGRSGRSETVAAVRAIESGRLETLGAVLVHLPPRLPSLFGGLPRVLGRRRGRSSTAAPSWPSPAPRGVSATTLAQGRPATPPPEPVLQPPPLSGPYALPPPTAQGAKPRASGRWGRSPRGR